jgi:hypothetical protein
MGERNFNNSSKRSRRSSTAKLRHSDKGKVFGHNGGMNRARASFQNELLTKTPSHHFRYRCSVRRSIRRSNALRICATRSGLRPCIMAGMSTATTPP